MSGFLSSSERSELMDELRRERSRKYAERLKAILLLDSGEKVSEIARFLFLDEGTVRNWKKRWTEGGIEKLINDHYVGRVSLLTDEEQEWFSAVLSSRIFCTTKEIIDFVEVEFGVTYTIGGMTDLLHRLGFSYKKPKGVPGKANRNKQEKFLRTYNQIKGRGLVYFADSTHPTLNPKLGYGWIKKGEEFEIKTNSGRQRVNINGAVEINTLDVVSRSCKSSNHQSICELLRAIRQKNSKEGKIYVVLDNAPYNRSWIVKNCARDLRIRLVYLPPYSPNLNPIERLWKFMKKKVMANRYYENLFEFQAAIANFFRSIRGQKKELSSLITDNFKICGT